MKRIIPITLLIAFMACTNHLWAFYAGVIAIRIWHHRTHTPIVIAQLIAWNILILMLLWSTHSILMTRW